MDSSATDEPEDLIIPRNSSGQSLSQCSGEGDYLIVTIQDQVEKFTKAGGGDSESRKQYTFC